MGNELVALYRIREGNAIDSAALVADGYPGVEAVRETRVRWEGHRLHAELAIGVSPRLTITEAHVVAHAVERELVHVVAHLDHLTVHVEPNDPSRDSVHAGLSHHR